MRFVVRETLEDQGSAELPDGNRVMRMSSWQDGNEQIISYLRVLAYNEEEGNRVMTIN